MFAKIRSLLQQSAVYGLGTIAARAVAFLLLPYYSHLMPPAEYGIYVLFMILVGLLQPLYMHGMDIAFLRFSASEGPDAQKRDLGMTVVHTSSVGVLLGIPLFLLAPQIAGLVVHDAGRMEIALTRMSAGILLLDTLANQIFTFLRIKNRAAVFSAIKIGNVLVNIGLNVYLVGVRKMGVEGAFEAFLITSALTTVLLLVIVHRELIPNWSWKKVRPWLEFGLPNVPALLFFIVLEFSDRKWLEALVGVDQAGIYSAGYRIGMLMSMVVQAFRYAWQPFFLKTAADGDARETFSRVMTYFIAVAGLIWLGSTLLLGDLLRFPLPGIGPLIDQRYWAGLGVFPIIMLAHIFNGVYANLMVGVYIEKKTKIIPLIMGAAALVNVIGNGLLIPYYGFWASAWLTVVSYALAALLMYLYIVPKYPVSYEWRRIVRIAMTIVAAWGVGDIIGDFVTYLPALWVVRALIVLAVPAIWWDYVLLPEERAGFRRRFRGKG